MPAFAAAASRTAVMSLPPSPWPVRASAKAFARRCAGRDRHPGRRRRAHPDREVLVGKIDRETRLHVALEHLGRPIGLEVVVARQRVRDHVVHGRRRKTELAAERQRLRGDLARRHGEEVVDDLHGDAAALRPAMDDLVAHRFKDRAGTLQIASRGADHEQAFAALGVGRRASDGGVDETNASCRRARRQRSGSPPDRWCSCRSSSSRHGRFPGALPGR